MLEIILPMSFQFVMLLIEIIIYLQPSLLLRRVMYVHCSLIYTASQLKGVATFPVDEP